MKTFGDAGEAMLLAQEGNQQVASAVAAAVVKWFATLKAWHRALPTSLPPTEVPR